jgi:hypothetical protein
MKANNKNELLNFKTTPDVSRGFSAHAADARPSLSRPEKRNNN